MESGREPRWIFLLQIASVAGIWVFVFGISGWILHLLRLSHQLHDVPSASIGISIVAIPVFLTGASVLTYVFVGLRRGREEVPMIEGIERRPCWVSGCADPRHGLCSVRCSQLTTCEPRRPTRSHCPTIRSRDVSFSPIASATTVMAFSGGKSGIGPSLGDGHFAGTFLDLGAALWNHVPGHECHIRRDGSSLAALVRRGSGRARGLLELSSIIWAVRAPPRLERQHFRDQRVHNCHAVGGGDSPGPRPRRSRQLRLAAVPRATDLEPRSFHVREHASRSGLRPPRFDDGDLADISAYVRQRAAQRPRESRARARPVIRIVGRSCSRARAAR